MKQLLNIKKYRVLLLIGYIFIFGSYLYSIYYSMPANDDFAWAIEWWSSNRLIETFHRIKWNYMNSFGNSGVFAIVVQILINPLYWFNNAGHSYGITMIIANAIIIIGILVSVREIFKYIFSINSNLVLDVLVFIIALLISTSYYYSDVYNWWSGTPGYSGMMMMTLITGAAILRYLNFPERKSNYILMIVVGMITCTSMMYCVAVGSFYVLFTFIVFLKNGDSFKKKIVPLAAYIFSGILMVIAPGNYARMSNEQSTGSRIIPAMIVTAYRVITRLTTTVQTKPWVIVLMLLIFVIGICYGGKKQQNLLVIVLGAICTIISAYSGVLLYVYGSNKNFDSEFTPRVYYVEDYLVFIGMAVVGYALGAWVNQKLNLSLDKIKAFSLTSIIVVVLLISIAHNQNYRGIIQVDIFYKSQLIQESWVFWDEILQVIEESETGADLVIDRNNVDWCQYSYYVGLDDIPREKLSDESKYGNCNQCASKYYNVDSIIVNLY